MDNNETIQLPPLCIRSLHDKLFEKKKLACREIEILTKELNSNGRTNQIKKLIEYFIQNFIENASSSSKIGGLIAVSSVATALDQDAKLYLEEIVKSIFICTNDCQRDVRYRALESLYNVAKCVRSQILVYLDEVFDIIIRSGEDSDAAIKEASLLMDKLIKDIVLENPSFNITTFARVIQERIYALAASTRKLILSWIIFLDSLPDVDLLIFIEDILDGLLKIACDSNLDIRRTAENILEEFFKKLQMNPETIKFKPLIKILLIHIQSDSHSVQNISLKWLDQFIKLGNNNVLCNSAHIVAVILGCFSYACEENNSEYENDGFLKKNIELAKSINENLMNLITKKNLNNSIEAFEISTVLVNELESGLKTSPQTKIVILEWICKIYNPFNTEIDKSLENKLVDILLSTLCDPSDNVVLLDLKVLSKIIFHDKTAKYEIENYRKLIEPLVDLFYKNQNILKDRGALIICYLCDTTDAQKVYITFADILKYKQGIFLCSMIHILNTILLTSKELSIIRNDLKNHNNDLFDSIYDTWCYSSVSVISLCLFTKRYRLASELILNFGNMDINVQILLEIDQLIQMLESPIFTSLRLDLINPDNNYYLRKSLYGLLMLLPQSEAFHLLRRRLQCIPNLPSESKIQGVIKAVDDPHMDTKISHYIKIHSCL